MRLGTGFYSSLLSFETDSEVISSISNHYKVEKLTLFTPLSPSLTQVVSRLPRYLQNFLDFKFKCNHKSKGENEISWLLTLQQLSALNRQS